MRNVIHLRSRLWQLRLHRSIELRDSRHQLLEARVSDWDVARLDLRQLLKDRIGICGELGHICQYRVKNIHFLHLLCFHSRQRGENIVYLGWQIEPSRLSHVVGQHILDGDVGRIGDTDDGSDAPTIRKHCRQRVNAHVDISVC